LLSDTEYTFEVRDLDNGAYKWKVECVDTNSNKAYSDERQFVVSEGNIAIAVQSNVQNSDDINTALDNMDKLTGDESSVVDILGIKMKLKDLLDRMNNMERDIQNLAYRRDLDANGMVEAEKNLTNNIEYLKNTTPMSLSITDSKTFVKYITDQDLKEALDEYSSIKNLNLDKKSFFDSTKLSQSEVIISTHVRNVRLYYLDGTTSDITLVTKDIQAAKPEDDLSINNSNSITFLEIIPKTISQTSKNINMITKDFTVIKEDPLIEFPSDIREITYYINGTLNLDEFQNTDTILIEKNINIEKSITGFSILGISSISDIKLDGRSIMIIVIVLLILFYLVINFDLIDKIRNLNIGFIGPGSKKKVSFIRVLINDALDYLKTEDYDKATMIYREIKLTYEEANSYVKKQVYDESFDLCNQMDTVYATKILDKIEYYLNCNNRNDAIIEFEKLEKTYNKLNESYQSKIEVRFKKILEFMKNRV
jgi:tetratricopeptide (TPR) repeat protein